MPDFDASPDPLPATGDRPGTRDPATAPAVELADPIEPRARADLGNGAAWRTGLEGEFFAPARVSARPPSTALALLQIIACSGFPTQFVATFLLILLGFPNVATPSEWSLAHVAALLLIDSVLLVGLIVTLLRLHGERPTDVFLGLHPVPAEIVRGVLLVPVVFALVALVAFFVQRYAPWLHNQTVNPFQSLIREPHGVLVVGALSIIVGGLREEIQRAFVLHRFTQIRIPMIGLGLFSVLFGLGHVIQGWDAVVMTTVLGAVWGLVYLRRRSLVAPAVCHGMFDVIQVAALGFLP